MEEMDDIIEKLQTLVAHQEMQIDELNEMTMAQWAEIDLLKRQISSLVSRLEDMDTGDSKMGDAKTVSEMAAAEKPPHY